MIKKRNWNGSFTVEAVLIMPLIIAVIFFFIYMALYLHDVAYVQSVIDTTITKEELYAKQPCVFQTSEILYEQINDQSILGHYEGNHEEEEQEMKAYIKERLTGKMMISKLKELDIDVTAGDIHISLLLERYITFVPVVRLLDNDLEYEIAASKSIHNPANFIRVFESICDVASEVKGMDKLKEFSSYIQEKVK